MLNTIEKQFLDNGNQIIPTGYYDEDDHYYPHTELTRAIYSKVIMTKNEIRADEVLELIYKENGQYFAQWHSHSTSAEQGILDIAL